MTIHRSYWTNTSRGHNKDYQVEWDEDTLQITKTYGPIGGHKTVKTVNCPSIEQLESMVEGIEMRRRARGYTRQVTYTDAPTENGTLIKVPSGLSKGSNFSRDVYEMGFVR